MLRACWNASLPSDPLTLEEYRISAYLDAAEPPCSS